MQRTRAARTRRVDPIPGATLNLEIIGIALLCIALLLALALGLPPGHSGSLGPLAAAALKGGFGTAAWLAIIALVSVAIIVFLELHALSKLAMLATCAALEFLVIDTWFGLSSKGGAIGNTLAHAVNWLLGPAGAHVVLIALAITCVLAPSGLSLKKLFRSITDRTVRVSQYAMSAAAAYKERAAETQTRRNDVTIRNDTATVRPSTEVLQNESLTAQRSVSPSVEETLPAATLTHDVASPHVNSEPELLEELPQAAAIVPIPEQIEVSQAAARRWASHRVLRASSDTEDALAAATSYRLPDYALFNPPEKRVHNETSAALVLEETLASFGVEAKVTHIERGPSVTRYEMTPGKGVKVSAIKSLADNIQLALAAQSIRIEAPIPGKAAVGIEVPNSAVAIVGIREILDYLPKGEGTLVFGLGKDITGRPIIGDLTRMPHLLVAGATGAGKSVCLNVILTSLLSTHTPNQLQLMLIDPKRVELTQYNGIPHLIKDCITDPKIAAGALYELTKEMDARYERFAHAGVRKIEEYNQNNPAEPLPFIVVVIDELADLMLVAPTRVETSICRIAQLARATGIHLIVATQRPSVDVITGLIKANIPSRIAFAVSSQVDSRTIIDMAGAERLLGRGDMLYLPIDAPKPVRVQGALVTGPELERLCEFWRAQDDPDNRIEIELSEVQEDGRGPADELAFEAAKIIIERQMASVALLQAELKVGHPRAVRLMKILEEFRVVGPTEGTKPRKILVGVGDMDKLASMLAPKTSEQSLF